MKGDIHFDEINNIAPTLGAEGEDVGNGTSSDYGGVIPKDIKPETNIPTESQLPANNDDTTPIHKSKQKPPVLNKPPAALPNGDNITNKSLKR